MANINNIYKHFQYNYIYIYIYVYAIYMTSINNNSMLIPPTS